MRERGVLWVVLAGIVAGLVGVAAVAGGGDDGPSPLPALALGAGAERAQAAGGPAADMMLAPQRVEYRFEGEIPDLPDEATAYRLPRTEVSELQVRQLAEALGLDGARVTRDDTGWVARTDERELRIMNEAGTPWYLSDASTCGPDTAVSSDGTTTGVSCVEAERVAASGGASGSAGSGSGVATPTDATGAEACPTCPPDADCPAIACATEPAPGPMPVPPEEEPPSCEMPECPPGTACAQVCPEPRPEPVEPPQRPADLPSKEEAEAIARRALSAAGVDLDGAKVRVEDGFDQWYVNVDPAVDGVPTTGWTSSAGVGSKGVIRFANGWLGDPDGAGDYPLATVARAIERLNEGSGGGWYPYGDPRVMAADAAMPDGQSMAVDAAMPVEGGGTGTETVVHHLTDVRLGLMFAPLQSEPGGMLVPTYLFTVREQPDFEVPTIAVADEYLPKPEPVPEPEPAPAPGTVPGGTGEQSCTGSGSSDGVEVQLCGPSRLTVGEEGSFTLTVVDPNGAFIDAGCAAPTVSFGDGDDPQAICDIGCVPPDPPQGKKFGTTATHAYREAGRYEVSGFVRMCGGGRGDVRVALPVGVE